MDTTESVELTSDFSVSAISVDALMSFSEVEGIV